MRPGSAAFIVSAAMVLGGLTGGVFLPERTPPVVPKAVRSAAPSSPVASPSTRRALGSGPITSRHLLSAESFRRVGLGDGIVTHEGDGGFGLAACSGAAGDRVMNEFATRYRVLKRHWTSRAGAISEEIVGTEDAFLAEKYVTSLILGEEVCQDEPAGHWIYGSTHTEKTEPGTSAVWLGIFGDVSTATGRALESGEPCGGVALIRNGSHFGVVSIGPCANAQQLAALSRAAAAQLG